MSKQVTFTLTSSQETELTELMQHMRGENVTIASALQKCVDQGIQQLQYRYKRNERVWKIQKAEKLELQQLREIVRAREIEDNDIVARD